MEETLERELLRASRKQLSLGIIMLDVDDFKQLNDTHGHAAGDAILRELGPLLLGNGSTSAAILKAADIALYRAKSEGRGRVVVAR